MSDDYEEYRRKVIDAQRQWNYDRSAIYFAQAFVASKFDGDYEDPRIKGPDNYDTMTLAEMVQKVNDMKPELVEAAGNAWMQISTDIKDAAAAFNTEFQKTVGGEGKAPAWGGASGAKAVEAVNNYATRTEPLGTAAHLVGIKLREMVTGLHQTKALMPTAEPPKDLDGKVLPPDGIMKEGDYTAEEAEDEGRRILRTVYGQVAHQTDHGVPVLPAAPKVVDDGPNQPYVPPGDGGGEENGGGETGGGTGETGGGTGETGGGTGETGGTGGGEDTGGGTGTEPEDTGTTAASAETQSTPQTTSTPTETSRAATTGATGTPTGTGYVPGGSGRSGSGSGFPGRGGGSGGGGSAGGSNQPGAGRSLPGGGQPQSGAAPAAAAAARGGAGAGRAGMAGMPMGGMGGGRGGGQDEEKQGQSAIKDYLINQQNGEELTGLDSMPKTVPPVLGEG